MSSSLEQIIRSIEQLTPPEQAKVLEWLEARRKPTPVEPSGIAPESDDERSQLTRKWLAENRSHYAGEWVALDGDRLISYGKDGRKVLAEAKASGINGLFFDLLVEDKKPFIGGWLP